MAVLNPMNPLPLQMVRPRGPWEAIILGWFAWIPNYGWRIVVFTVFLKLVLSPLDIFQRYKMRKNQAITERIKPEMEKLQQQYAGDKTTLSQKQMQLQRKEGFSYFSSCLPMILTLVIFFWLFSGLQSISQYMTMNQYTGMYNEFIASETAYIVDGGIRIDYIETPATNDDGTPKLDKDGQPVMNVTLGYTIAPKDDPDVYGENRDPETVTYTPAGSSTPVPVYTLTGDAATTYINIRKNEAVSAAQVAVEKIYNEDLKVSFLWIKNIWSPDVPWKKPILNSKDFKSAANKFGTSEAKSGIDKAELDAMIARYDEVTSLLQSSSSNKTNGLLIFPLLSVGLSFLSQFITTRQQKKSGQAQAGAQQGMAMKMMMFIMPLMMGFFALSYTAVFTLYIVTNSAMSLLLNLGTTGVLTLIDKKKGFVTVGHTAKKVKLSSGEEVIEYGRPDFSDRKKEKSGDSTDEKQSAADPKPEPAAEPESEKKKEKKKSEPGISLDRKDFKGLNKKK